MKVTSSAAPRRKDITEVVRVCRRYGAVPYLGGGLTDDAVANGILHTYVKELRYRVTALSYNISY